MVILRWSVIGSVWAGARWSVSSHCICDMSSFCYKKSICYTNYIIVYVIKIGVHWMIVASSNCMLCIILPCPVQTEWHCLSWGAQNELVIMILMMKILIKTILMIMILIKTILMIMILMMMIFMIMILMMMVSLSVSTQLIRSDWLALNIPFPRRGSPANYASLAPFYDGAGDDKSIIKKLWCCWLLPKKLWGCCKNNCGAVAQKLWCCCKKCFDTVAKKLWRGCNFFWHCCKKVVTLL